MIRNNHLACLFLYMLHVGFFKTFLALQDCFQFPFESSETIPGTLQMNVTCAPEAGGRVCHLLAVVAG